VGVGEGDVVQWVPVALFGATAEAVATLATGSSVSVEGKIKLDRWQTKDGEQRSGLGAAASRAEPIGQLGRKRTARPAKSPESDARDWQQPIADSGSLVAGNAGTDRRMELEDDQIPF
jgi:single-stranded DNA-binding protein